jgi:hypothetical protein
MLLQEHTNTLLSQNQQLQAKLDLFEARLDSVEFQYTPVVERFSQLYADLPSLAGNCLVEIPSEFLHNNTWPAEHKKRFYQSNFGKWKTRGVWAVVQGVLKPTKSGLKNVSHPHLN